MDDTSTPDDDLLNIDLDDLDDEPTKSDQPAGGSQPAGGGSAADGRFAPVSSAPSDELVIELDDLSDPSLDAPVYPAASRYGQGSQPGLTDAPGKYAPVDAALGDGYSAFKAKKSPLATIFGNLMVQMLIAGLIGGLAAWLINEPWTHDNGGSSDAMTALRGTALFFAIIGAMIGMALGAVEGFLSGIFAKMAKGGAIGLLIGAVGGAIAGVLAQLIYGYLSSRGAGASILTQIFARTLGWTMVGLGIGVAQGIRYRNTKRLINGLLGGAVGGFAGGLLFDPISMVTGSGVISRLVGIVAIGAASGAAIGLLETIRKEAWITIVEGPMTGKEFILYKPITQVGSAAHSDIPLFKDTNVAPDHLRIQQVGNGFELASLVGAEAVYVNGAPTAHHRLRKGDMIHVGNTAFIYQDRAVEP